MEIKVLHQVMEWNQQVGDEVRAALAADKVCMADYAANFVRDFEKVPLPAQK